jgi:hypothetical protein
MDDIQILSEVEIRSVAGGSGIEGRVGVLYQSGATGKLYRWDPVGKVMVEAGAASGVGGSIPAWAVSTAYAAIGQVVLTPAGDLVSLRVAHTSGPTYDARYWTYPSNDGATLFDFTQLPDGVLSTAKPQKGILYGFNLGGSTAREAEFKIAGGTLQENTAVSGRGVIYFEGALVSGQRADGSFTGIKVQHMWFEFDIPASPASGVGITFLSSNLDPAFSAYNGYGVHWSYIPSTISGDVYGSFAAGPYPGTLGSVITTPTVTATLSSAAIGTGITLTASGATFAATDVNRAFGGNGGAGIITAYTSPTVVTITLKSAATGTALAAGNWNIGSEPPTWNPPVSQFGKRVRVDITVDQSTGMMAGYWNGQQVLEYTDLSMMNYTGHTARCEFGNGALIRLARFGISGELPSFHKDGSKKLTTVEGVGFVPAGLLQIQYFWQEYFTFVVAFDVGGAVEITWAKPIKFDTAVPSPIFMVVTNSGLGGGATLPGIFTPCMVANSGTLNEIVVANFRQVLTGTPGTTRKIGLYVQAPAYAKFLDNTAGGDTWPGPTWRPVIVGAGYR